MTNSQLASWLTKIWGTTDYIEFTGRGASMPWQKLELSSSKKSTCWSVISTSFSQHPENVHFIVFFSWKNESFMVYIMGFTSKYHGIIRKNGYPWIIPFRWIFHGSNQTKSSILRGRLPKHLLRMPKDLTSGAFYSHSRGHQFWMLMDTDVLQKSANSWWNMHVYIYIYQDPPMIHLFVYRFYFARAVDFRSFAKNCSFAEKMLEGVHSFPIVSWICYSFWICGFFALFCGYLRLFCANFRSN